MRYVEKFKMAEFILDSGTIERFKCVLHIGYYLVPLVRSNMVLHFISSGMMRCKVKIFEKCFENANLLLKLLLFRGTLSGVSSIEKGLRGAFSGVLLHSPETFHGH